ncbi:DUF1336-domain-containing protein [Coccomyxa subellipsoidea C-169]|uniref:DUF1336-domain-containing protein n=1 Tax=Coccomyxa subellipsoidea (strain C-169) TaxID=574566 RepID=I0YV38_COCSC|nr:DUF1336-domain-containing protein [Coccomyxa subellipsoidea C-169]EIE22257.1 DUF1336-domain-containing protein [Coccomyxa subellipsoidea C-169]|eukprot:XP_005646801.1 DUF1336-domain-containing protein [Coccomyxa subellipsoidea C-169]
MPRNKEFREYRDKFGTTRKATSDKLTQVWTLNRRYRLGILKERKFRILDEGRNNSALALAKGNYQERDLFCFKLHNGKHLIKDTDKVTLAFHNEEEARLWYTTFQTVIGDLAAKAAAEPRSGSSNQPDTPALQRGQRPRISVITPSLDTDGDLGQSPDSATPPAMSAAPSYFSEGLDMSHLEQPSMTCPTDVHSPGMDMTLWEAWYCHDGVTVFFGTSEENEDVIMVSLIVHAPPSLVTEVLLKNDILRSASNIGLQSSRVLEQADDHTVIFTGRWVPGGWAATLLAPRDVVVKRTWRREDDGTYVVLMQSIDHPLVPRTDPPFYQWTSPIRAEIEFSGYTLAPLQAQYANHASSQETLITHVIKADMGGWVRHMLTTSLPQPLLRWSSIWYTVIKPVVHHNVMLRNRAEAERFVTRPFLMGSNEAPPPTPSPSNTAAERLARTSRLASRKTTSIFTPAQVDAPSEDGAAQEGPSESDGLLAEEAPEADPTACATGTCDKQFWSCPGNAGFKVRGPNYLRDKKKVLADDPLFALAAVDLLEMETPTFHIARYLPSLKKSKAPFTFIVNIMVPSAQPFSLVMSWAADADQSGSSGLSSLPTPRGGSGPGSLDEGSDNGRASDPDSPFDLSLARFLAGGDRERNATFKLIPRVTQGSWIIKQSVGTTPCLLGNKLTAKYFQGDGYVEVDIDVGSSSVAATVVGLVQGATKSLVVDMGIVLEGHTRDELPESLLGTVRFSKVDLSTAQYLDTATGRIGPRPGNLTKITSRDRNKQKDI